jgi:D-mannonate dehydratase
VLHRNGIAFQSPHIRRRGTVGYQYMLMPDHMPAIDGRDPSGTAFAFGHGHIRGLPDAIGA